MQNPGLVKTQEGDITVYTSRGQRIDNPQQIIDQIGLDPDKEYVSDKEARAFEGQQKGPDGKPTIIQMWSVGVKIKSLFNPTQKDILEATQKQLSQYKHPTRDKVEQATNTSKLLGVLPIYDAHFGKLDLKGTSLRKQVNSVVKGGKQAIDRMTDSGVQKILQVWGGDTDNTDHDGKTTRGTQQEHNAPMIEVYKAVNDVEMELASYSGQKVDTVVDILSGNHDEEKALFHRAFLQHVFKDHPNVTVLDHQEDFSVYKHGQVGLLLDHGDKLKPKSIISVINRYVNGVKHYERISGHSHKIFYVDFNGAKWRGQPSSGPKNGRSTSNDVGSDYNQIMSIIYDMKGPLETFTTRL